MGKKIISKKETSFAPTRAIRLFGLTIGLLTAIAASWLFCAPGMAQERVRMALSVRNVVFLPFYYAKDAKIFDKHGLNVELIQMRSDLQVVGLISGEIDYIPVIGPATTPIANGAPLKALATMYKAPLFSLAGVPGLASVKSLEGKKVAVSRIGSDSHRYGSLLIESGGADPKKVTFIQTGSTTISLTSLQQGAVDAAVLSPPFTGIVAEKGFKILARSRQLVDSPWLGLVANKLKIDKQPEQVRNMLRSMRDVVAAIRRDKAGVISYIAKNFNVSAANAAESYDDIAGVIIDSMILRDELIQKHLDGAHQRGELPKPLLAADMFDFSLLRSLR
jgi:ABC-type nitrate/sulfonate/bicarbonate transport system substrate-binding protein